MSKSIIISGFGGQGVMMLGNIIGRAAFEQGMQVTITPAYGNEQRGGTANCTVVFDESYVASPVVEHPDVLIAMNQPSVDRFFEKLSVGGIAMINSSLAHVRHMRDDVKVVEIPVDALAIEKFGSSKAANIIMAGAFTQAVDGISGDVLEGALLAKAASKPQFLEMNRQALALGRELGKQ